MLHNSEKVRSFIAIELPEDIKGSLARLRSELEGAEHTFVKWVDAEGIHLTLKFLGNIPLKQVPEITEAIEEARQGIPCFHLGLSDLGFFPNLKQPRVFWIGIGGELDKLLRLQQNIDNALIPFGFAKEEHTFVPHLTLARIKQAGAPAERKKLAELAMSLKLTDEHQQMSFVVASISLMRSQLTPQGAIYTHLSTIEL